VDKLAKAKARCVSGKEYAWVIFTSLGLIRFER